MRTLKQGDAVPADTSAGDGSPLPPFARQLLGLLGTADALVAVYDPNGGIRYANRAYRETFFLGADETLDWITLMRRNHALRRGPVVAHDDFEAWLSSCLSRRGKVPTLTIETDLYDGRWLWILENTVEDGHILFVALDITGRRQSNRALRQERDTAVRAACTDELTGVSNRAHIMRLLGDAVRDATRTTAVAIVDIDHFKAINDRFGHAVGDDVLRHFARIVRSSIRTCDAFGRIGGEEFLILFPGSTLSSVEAAITRLQRRVAAATMIADRPDCRVGFSAGLTTVRTNDTACTVYTRADTALYAAKMAGRGRLRLAG